MGVGLIGGSIGLAVRHRLPEVRVVGIDRQRVLRIARRRGALHEGTVSLARGLSGVDLVVLALPVDSILRELPRVARHASPFAIVTDVGSTKEAIVEAAQRAGLRWSFVGGHPMAGSERCGIQNAERNLFSGAPWILCPPARTTGHSAVSRVASLVRRLGARPALLSGHAHDEVLARLSHLPQLISVALVNAAVPHAGRHLNLAGPAFQEMSRLAMSPPSVWKGILRTNRRAVAGAVDDFIRELRRLRGSLARRSAAHFRRAARSRERLPKPARRPSS